MVRFNLMVWIIVIGLIFLSLFLYFRFFKIPKIKNLVFVDGGLGAGKTYFCVSLAVRLYKRACFRYRLAKVLLFPFSLYKGKSKRLSNLAKKWHRLEKPCLYSNIPLRNVEFSRLTVDVLLRRVRIPVHSVVLIDDVSLVVDQMNFRDRELSKQLSLFFKLARHSFDGYVILNSQTTSDLHYSIKYALSDYLYIHSNFRIPFFRVLRVQEMFYSADKDSSSLVSATTKDVEDTLKMVVCRSRYRKYYDTRCFSILTDDLNVYEKPQFIRLCEAAKTVDILTLDPLTLKLLVGGKY